MTEQVQQPPEPSYFAIHHALGDNSVWAIVRINNGIYEMWTGQDGDEEWVDMPFFATYFVGGELGARGPIEQAEVEELKGTVTPPSLGAVSMMRGTPEGRTDVNEEPAAEPDGATDTGVDTGVDKTAPDTASPQVSEGAAEDTTEDDK